MKEVDYTDDGTIKRLFAISSVDDNKDGELNSVTAASYSDGDLNPGTP